MLKMVNMINIILKLNNTYSNKMLNIIKIHLNLIIMIMLNYIII